MSLLQMEDLVEILYLGSDKVYLSLDPAIVCVLFRIAFPELINSFIDSFELLIDVH